MDEEEEEEEKVPEPEKLSVLEPIAYENRNNYALPYMRTTFY